jgi:hypothetical protein
MGSDNARSQTARKFLAQPGREVRIEPTYDEPRPADLSPDCLPDSIGKDLQRYSGVNQFQSIYIYRKK